MSRNKINIKDRLPIYSSPDSIWDKIEHQLNVLDKEDINKKFVEILPTYSAPNGFEEIMPLKRSKPFIFNLIQIAASIILIIGLTFVYKQFKNKASVEITHSIEYNVVASLNGSSQQYAIDSDFDTILEQKCKANPNICELKEFDDLFAQLKDIEIEEHELKKAFEQFKTPDIENYIIKITNDKIKLEKYILQLFI